MQMVALLLHNKLMVQLVGTLNSSSIRCISIPSHSVEVNDKSHMVVPLCVSSTTKEHILYRMYIALQRYGPRLIL